MLLLWVLRAFVLTLAIARIATAPQSINPDGVSYLDVADEFLQWRLPLHALDYWSPLYPALIALFKQLPLSEILSVRLLNFVLLIAAMVAFERFLTACVADRIQDSISRGIFYLLGYGIFIWSTLSVISVESVTPDLTVFAITCYAAVLLERSLSQTRRTGARLGLVLGIGYYAKAIMFPVAIFFCATLFLFGRSRGRKAAAYATATFLAVAAPLVILLSVHSGHPTFGSSARLNYAWYVQRVPKWIHWQGDAIHGSALSPTKVISEQPLAYSFSEPFTRATYPPWFAPPYWHQGLQLSFDADRQLAAIRENLAAASEILRPVALALILIGIAAIASKRCGGVHRYAWILIGVSTIALYTLVHLEGRFVAPALTLILVVLASCVDTSATRRGGRVLCGMFVIAGMVLIAAPINELVERYIAPSRRASREEALVRLLSRSGARSGDPVAVIGDAIDASWARRSGLRIIAEVPRREMHAFAAAPEATQRGVLERFASVGARLVVAEASARPKTEGWIATDDGGFLIRQLGIAPRSRDHLSSGSSD